MIELGEAVKVILSFWNDAKYRLDVDELTDPLQER